MSPNPVARAVARLELTALAHAEGDPQATVRAVKAAERGLADALAGRPPTVRYPAYQTRLRRMGGRVVVGIATEE
jgi:hypothetical protein